MDLPLYLQVLKRHRTVVIAGLATAVVLAFFSIVTIGSGGFALREKEQWVSRATVFVTQQGFPAGRLGLTQQSAGQAAGKAPSDNPGFIDPARFQALAILYSQLATTDDVTKIIERSGPLGGTVASDPVTLPKTNEALPMVLVAGLADSSGTAERLAGRAAAALITYIEDRQIASRTPAAQRVSLEIVRQPTKAELVHGRSLTRPIVIFLALALGTVMLAFLLENLRRRREEAEHGDGDGVETDPPVPGEWENIGVDETLANAAATTNGRSAETVTIAKGSDAAGPR